MNTIQINIIKILYNNKLIKNVKYSWSWEKMKGVVKTFYASPHVPQVSDLWQIFT